MSAKVADPAAFADILLSDRPRDARASAMTALEGGLAPRALYLDVLGPAMIEVGARWQRGLATVGQEHLATAVVATIMATMAPRLEEAPPLVGRRIALACSEGEVHGVGLQMVVDFLEADGWQVDHLGAMTPAAELIDLATRTKPDVVGLSTALTTHLATAGRTIAALHALPARPVVIVGGQAYGGDEKIALGLGADAFANDAGQISRYLRERFAAVEA